jgi:hypothetical protein
MHKTRSPHLPHPGPGHPDNARTARHGGRTGPLLLLALRS